MARRKLVRMSGDVREHFRYSIEEASRYLHIPLSTMKAWARGQNYVSAKSGRSHWFAPVIELADAQRGLLSFYNLAECHVLRATRDRNIPLINVRRALAFIREEIPSSSHPLLSHDFSTFGKSVFIKHLGDTINATRHGQKAMQQLLESYLDRIDRDALGMPIQIYPMNTNYLAINPTFSSGKPVVKGTRIMACILADRKKAGESYADLSGDYGLTHSQIEHAITEYAAS